MLLLLPVHPDYQVNIGKAFAGLLLYNEFHPGANRSSMKSDVVSRVTLPTHFFCSIYRITDALRFSI